MGRPLKTDRRQWSPEEIELLRSCIGHWPFRLAVRRYQKLRCYHQLPIRTPRAIKAKALRLGWSCHNHLDNMSVAAWAKALKLPRSTVQRWHDSYDLGIHVPGKLTAIPTSKMKTFAERHPRKFASCDPDALASFFGRKLAQAIGQHEPFKPLPRPVICNRTGKVYPSLLEAARHHPSSPNRIKREAEKNGEFSFLQAKK